MTAAVLVAWAVVRMRRPRRLGGGRPRARLGDAEYFDAVAAELRRGASLRHAIAAPVAGSVTARLAVSGQPMGLVVAALERELDPVDGLAAAGIELAGETGAPSATLFSRLAERARARRQLEGERRALSAQARFSAAVVGLMPLGIGLMLGVARGGSLMTKAATRLPVLLGLGMQLAGVVLLVLLMRAQR